MCTALQRWCDICTCYVCATSCWAKELISLHVRMSFCGIGEWARAQHSGKMLKTAALWYSVRMFEQRSHNLCFEFSLERAIHSYFHSALSTKYHSKYIIEWCSNELQWFEQCCEYKLTTAPKQQRSTFGFIPKIHVLTWRNQKLLIVRHMLTNYIVIVPTTFHSLPSLCTSIIGYDVCFAVRIHTGEKKRRKIWNEWICDYVKWYTLVHTVTVWMRVGRPVLVRKINIGTCRTGA